MVSSKRKKGSKGKGWHGDSVGHAAAGSLGGLATSLRQGDTFYSEIGRKGGQKSRGNFKNDPKRASEAGRKGGRARGKSYINGSDAFLLSDDDLI